MEEEEEEEIYWATNFVPHHASPALPWRRGGGGSAAATAATHRPCPESIALLLQRRGPHRAQLEARGGGQPPRRLRQHLPIRMRLLPASRAGMGESISARFQLCVRVIDCYCKRASFLLQQQ